MKIIKAYKTLTTAIKGNSGLPYDCDIACAEFRSFYQTASVHVRRVNDPAVQDVFAEILDNLKNQLQERRQQI